MCVTRREREREREREKLGEWFVGLVALHITFIWYGVLAAKEKRKRKILLVWDGDEWWQMIHSYWLVLAKSYITCLYELGIGDVWDLRVAFSVVCCELWLSYWVCSEGRITFNFCALKAKYIFLARKTNFFFFGREGRLIFKSSTFIHFFFWSESTFILELWVHYTLGYNPR